MVKKLTKLKNKQLPLLYNSFTNPLLKKINLKSENIAQRVYFKAQLFVPLSLKNNSFDLINNECIQGFYIHFNELKQFSDCKFFIPSKINWLQAVQTQTRWLTYNLFLATYLCELILNTPFDEAYLHQIMKFSPGRFKLIFLQNSFQEIFIPHHASCETWRFKLARVFLYMRGHLIRMPLKLLVPHLCRKSVMAIKEAFKKEEPDSLLP